MDATFKPVCPDHEQTHEPQGSFPLKRAEQSSNEMQMMMCTWTKNTQNQRDASQNTERRLIFLTDFHEKHPVKKNQSISILN